MADDVGDAGLGARLALALEARGMSDGALQRAANLPKAYVGRLLRGERPNIGFQTLNAIADALDVTYTWLATGEGPMNRGDAPPSPQAIVRELVARYPNAVEAASIAGRMGIESKAIEEVFGEVYASKDDFPVETWIARMREVHDRNKRDELEPARVEKREALSQAKVDEKRAKRPAWGKK